MALASRFLFLAAVFIVSLCYGKRLKEVEGINDPTVFAGALLDRSRSGCCTPEEEHAFKLADRDEDGYVGMRDYFLLLAETRTADYWLTSEDYWLSPSPEDTRQEGWNIVYAAGGKKVPKQILYTIQGIFEKFNVRNDGYLTKDEFVGSLEMKDVVHRPKGASQVIKGEAFKSTYNGELVGVSDYLSLLTKDFVIWTAPTKKKIIIVKDSMYLKMIQKFFGSDKDFLNTEQFIQSMTSLGPNLLKKLVSFEDQVQVIQKQHEDFDLQKLFWLSLEVLRPASQEDTDLLLKVMTKIFGSDMESADPQETIESMKSLTADEKTQMISRLSINNQVQVIRKVDKAIDKLFIDSMTSLDPADQVKLVSKIMTSASIQ